MTEWDEAAFRKLAEAVADELGLASGPAWEENWHSGAHLMARNGNGTGWSLSHPGGWGAKGMTTITPIWPGRSWPPGGVKITAGITARRGPEVIAARIRQLVPAYRLALAELAEAQAREAAEQARREDIAAQITAMIPDDPEPDRDPRYPRVRVSPTSDRSSMTDLYISGAGTVKYFREGAEIEIDRFRAPANVVLAMLRAYAETPGRYDPLVVGPLPNYTHELRDPQPPPERPRLRVLPGRIDGPLRSDAEPRPAVRRLARPELIAGAAWLLGAASNERAKQEPGLQRKEAEDG